MSKYDQQLKDQIVKRLVFDNPWWTTGEIADDYDAMPRRPYIDLFYPIVADLSVRRAAILMGPRRVGKTVMIYHSIKRLIDSGVDPRKIVYLSVDTPIYSNVSLDELFSYARTSLHTDEVDGFFVFYDEIQYLKDWEVHLKSMVDTYRKTKFVASGSAAAALLKMKSNESGAGRFTDFMLPPLTFFEFLRLQRRDGNVVEVKDCSICPYDTLDIDKLNEYFFEYINYGGYPEVVFSEKIKENPSQYIKNDIVEKVLLRDLPSLYGISDIQELNKLFLHIAFRSGNEFSYETLSSEAGIKKETIKKYLEYLEAAFLIRVVNRIDQNAKRLQRVTSMKIYLTNPTLRCALYSPVSESDDACGEMVETAIYDQWILGDKTNFYYANWSNGRDKGEVDIVWVEAATQKAFSLAEVKWTDKFFEDPSQLKSLRKFLEANEGVRKIIVTTKSKLGSATVEGKEFLFIPSALYAYWVSKYLFEDKTAQILLPAACKIDAK